MSGINKNMGCKATHDLNKYLDEIDAQSRKEDQDEEMQIAKENDIEQAFISGPLNEEFDYIEEGEVWTREDVIDEGADELCATETMINLFSVNVSDEVKLKVLSDIREKIMTQLKGG